MMTDSGDVWTPTAINEQLRKRLENHDSAKVTNLASQNCIAVNMSIGKNLTFDGDAGDNLAGLNKGSKVILNGNAGRFVGNGANKGEIIINGNCGDGVAHCLSGGNVIIQGNVNGEAGPSMHGGNLIITGNVSGDVGSCMDGGTIIICGDIGGAIGKMLQGGKIFAAGSLDKEIDIEEKKSTPSELKSIKKTIKEYGINATGLNFRRLSPKITKQESPSKLDCKSISDRFVISPAVLNKRPRTPGLDQLDLSMTIGQTSNEPLNLTIPLLWEGSNAPVYAEWKINGSAPNNLDSANLCIIDLTPTQIGRRLDMKKPSDLRLVIELIKEGTGNRIPIVVRISAGDIQNDIAIISKAGAEGVIIRADNLPIETVVSSARVYKDEITILATCHELDVEMAAKVIAIGASGIFLEKECRNKELNDFGSKMAEIIGIVGVSGISNLEPGHLRATDQESAAMTGVPLAGYDSVLPMWRH